MVLMFEWVLKFRIWVLTVMIGTYVYGILVILMDTYAPEFIACYYSGPEGP